MAVSSLFADYLPQDYLSDLPDESRMYQLWLESAADPQTGMPPPMAEQIAVLNTIRQGRVPYGVAPLSGVGLATPETLPFAPITERPQTERVLDESGGGPNVVDTTTNTPRDLMEAAESGGYIQADPVNKTYEGDNRPTYIKERTNITADQYNQFLSEFDDAVAQSNLDYRQAILNQRMMQEATGTRYSGQSQVLQNQQLQSELFNQAVSGIAEKYGVPMTYTTKGGDVWQLNNNGKYTKSFDAGEFGIGDFVKLGVSFAVGNALGPLIAGGLSGAVGTTAANIIGSSLGSGFATGLTTGFDTDAMLDAMLSAGLTQGTMELLKTDAVRQALNSVGESIGLPTEFTDTEILDIDGNVIQQGTTTTEVLGLGDTLATLVGDGGSWSFDTFGARKPFFFDKTITSLLDFVPDSVLKALDPYITGRGEQLGYLADFITGQAGSSGGRGGAGGEAGITTTTVTQKEEEEKEEEEKDTDNDGIPDSQDTDIDGDGVFNNDDPDPYDPSIFQDTTDDDTTKPTPLSELPKAPIDQKQEVFVEEDVTDPSGFGKDDQTNNTTTVVGDDDEDKTVASFPLPTQETLQKDKQEEIFVDAGVTDGGGFGMNDGGDGGDDDDDDDSSTIVNNGNDGDDGDDDDDDDGNGIVIVNQGGSDLNQNSDEDDTIVIGGTVQPPTIGGGGGGSSGGMFSLGGTGQSTRPSPFMASISFDPQLLTPLMPKQSKDYLAELLGRLQR